MEGLHLVSIWYQNATNHERHLLAHVYSSLKAICPHVPVHVQNAEILEILEQHDHQAWPPSFQLANCTQILHRMVMLATEFREVDYYQRTNYFQLLSGGRNRHRDVAHGLSAPLLWGDQHAVVDALLSMGRRQYSHPVPDAHEMDDGILHIAISYKHAARFDDGGTVSKQVAQAVWAGVLGMDGITKDSLVRVWVDQNLHRANFDEGTQWHEYGLLPYACLKVLVVGNGVDRQVLALAETRPWLWVEAVAGLRGQALFSLPGVNIMEGTERLFLKGRSFRKAEQMITKFGMVMGTGGDVDKVMEETSRTVAFWRRDFLGHRDYDYAEDFELFVNWARRFVLRGKRYSEMGWNHSSDPVVGMDAVALIRAFPSATWFSESTTAMISPRVAWTVAGGVRGVWTVGDLIDRSLIDNVPLGAIIEAHHSKSGDAREVLIVGKSLKSLASKFRKEDRTVELVTDEEGDSDSCVFGKLQIRAVVELTQALPIVRWQFSCSEKHKIVTYLPFTKRFLVLRRGVKMPLGDATILPKRVGDAVRSGYGLREIAYCMNYSSGEVVYEMEVDDGAPLPLSTSEVVVLHFASGGKKEVFEALVKVMKRNCEYKTILYRDMTEGERRSRARGWSVDLERLENPFIASGEVEDISWELFEALRNTGAAKSLVFVDDFPPILDRETVQVFFRDDWSATRVVLNKKVSVESLALIATTETNKLAKADGTGVLQLITKFQSNSKPPDLRLVEATGKLRHTGQQAEMVACDGVFITCHRCKQIVCPINGLVIEYQQKEGDTYVTWRGVHGCIDPIYY